MKTASVRNQPLCPLSLFLLLFLCLLWPAPSSRAADLTGRWPSCATDASSQKISFVHVSDTHASYNPDSGGSSPMARIRGFADQVRRENPYTLFTNAGDDYEKGSLAEELSQGRTTREVALAMNYDIRTLGNHDFAWGLDELLKFSQDPHAIVLSANTTLINADKMEKSPQAGWTGYAELTVGCIKIGVFGLVSKPWAENDEQYDGPYYTDQPQLQSNFDFTPTVEEIIAKHRQDVDLLVLISHLGIDDDIRLAGEQPGIDIILGGHTHTTMTEPQRVGNTMIIHPGSHAETAARYDLTYDLKSKQIMASRFVLMANRHGEMVANTSTDEEIRRIISPYMKEIKNNFARVSIPQSPRDMAQIAARAALATGQCDAAFVRPYQYGTTINAGWLSRQDILDSFPVEREPAASPGINSLYLLPVTGINLLHARATLPNFAFAGPKVINPSAIYTIALPKAQALRQLDSFGHEIGLEPAIPTIELWEMVTAFGQKQNNAHLALNDQTSAQADKLIAGIVRETPAEQIP